MTSKCFIDSNIWIYALGEQEESFKGRVSSTLVTSKNFIVSVQVINEVLSNLKRRYGFIESEIREVIDYFYAECSKIVKFDKTLFKEASIL